MDDGFDAFWQLYPRKVARKSAHRAWVRLHPDAALYQQLVMALSAQRQSPQWRDSLYIPYLATWLNGERWLDVLPLPTTGVAYGWTCPHTPRCPHRAACEVVAMRRSA